MACLPSFAIPNQPQHIIQHGNNRQVTFASAVAGGVEMRRPLCWLINLKTSQSPSF
jgi:hypothetical protein